MKIEYKGPSIHERVLSRKDFEAAGVDFKEDEKFPTLRFAADKARRAVTLEASDTLSQDTIDAIVEILEAEGDFTVTDGKDEVVKAKPGADEVNPDGTSKVSKEKQEGLLTEALGEDAKNPPNAGSTTDGGTASSTSAASTTGNGSSTAGR